jgi:hypothetical protein
MQPSSALTARIRAAVIHAAISTACVSAMAALVFLLWYPGALSELSGSGRLFWIIAGVDLALGPLLTAVVFNVQKKRAELALDVGCIAALQVLALAYGVWVMAAARPVHVVFEVDLFRVVTVNEVIEARLPQAPGGLRTLPWTGPQTIGVLKPTEAAAQFESMMLGTQGVHLAQLPSYWVPYERVVDQVQQRAQPLAALNTRDAEGKKVLAQALAKAGLNEQTARWLPLVSARASWVALIDPQGRWVGSAAIDSF